VTSIGPTALANCTNLTSITIPDNITSIGQAAFQGCVGLTNAIIGHGITVIGEQTFIGCSNLSSVSLPPGLIGIALEAFDDCTALSAITIGSNVANIGQQAFDGCSHLTTISIPASVTTIGPDAFLGCSSLAAINVDSSNSVYSSVGGVLFDKNQSTLIRFPGGLAGSYTVPASVNNLAGDAFEGCTNLANLIIPPTISNLAMDVFANCFSLTTVDFQGNAPVADSTAFTNDVATTVYYLPGTIGWSNSYAGVPTAPWYLPNPIILNNSANFGVQSNGFGFLVSWATNTSAVVEATTNLTNPVWIPVQTNTLTNGSFSFSEPLLTNSPGRYYRIISQ
jgi:hypothetical protein